MWWFVLAVLCFGWTEEGTFRSTKHPERPVRVSFVASQDFITISLTVPGSTWVSVGISPDGMMAHADVALFEPFNTFLDCQIVNASQQGVLVKSNPSFYDTVFSVRSNTTRIRYTRPLQALSDQDIAIDPSTPFYLIYAIGKSATFSHHEFAGSFPLVLQPKVLATGTKTVTTPRGPLVFDYALHASTVDLRMRVPGTSWVSLGVSRDGKMWNSSVVVYEPLRSVYSAFIANATESGIRRDTELTIQCVRFAQSNNETVLSFRRFLQLPNTIPVRPSQTTHFIYAVGQSNVFAHHQFAGDIPLQLASGKTPTGGSQVQMGPMTVTYQLHSDAVGFQVESKVSGRWMGFGVSPSGRMVGSDAIIALNDKVQLYVLAGKDQSSIKPITSSCLSQIKVHQGKGTAFSFQRSFVGDEASGCHGIDTSQPTTFVWAQGGSSFGPHGSDSSNFGALSINWATGETQVVYTEPAWHLWHGVLMTIAWGVLTPAGVLVAKFYKDWQPWFKVHRAIQAAAALLTIIAVSIAIALVPLHAQSTHAMIGYVVFAAAVLQPINAVLRPPKADTGPAASKRQGWFLIHAGMGWSILVLGYANLILGTKLIQTPSLKHAFLVSSSVFIAVSSSALVAHVLHSSRRAKPRYNALAAGLMEEAS